VEIIAKLIELLVGIAWPLAALVALLIFRSPLTTLLTTRSIKVGTAGIELEIPTQAGKTAVSSDEIDKLLENTNPLIKPYVDKIRHMVEEYLSERRKYTTFDDNSLLTFALIDTFGALRLERAYYAIFGSQISAIYFAHHNGGMCPIDQVKIFYGQATTSHPEIYHSYTFDQWLSYLTNMI
jgi:hypothetical protein